jgi:Nuclease-related domain
VGYEVGKPAGHWVREQSSRRIRRLSVGFAIFFVVCGAWIGLALGHALSVVASAIFLATVLLVRPLADAYVDQHLRLLDGTQAEEAVGQTLDELVREGWTVMHDIEDPGGNIDHIASGPAAGVYLIETKARRYQDAHLGKAKWQAKMLHDRLGVWVTPVICVHRRSRSSYKHKGVWIVTHDHLLDWLRSQHNAVLPFERLARFTDSV